LFPLSLNLFSREKKLSLRGLDRARASPSTRALSKPDADLAAALAAHEATSHLVAGWPASGEDGGGRDDLKARLLSAVRSRLAAPGTAGAGEGGRGGTEEGDEEQQLESLRQSILVAPAPQKRPRQLENASDPAAPPRADDYYWLRDDTRKAKDVLSHLAAENAYVAASLADTNGVKDKITKELRAAIQEADEGAPVRKAGYWWWWRTKEVGFSPSSTPPPPSRPLPLSLPLSGSRSLLSLSLEKNLTPLDRYRGASTGSTSAVKCRNRRFRGRRRRGTPRRWSRPTLRGRQGEQRRRLPAREKRKKRKRFSWTRTPAPRGNRST